MHYSCFVFTKEFPTDDVLYRALMPFNEEDFYNNDGETKEYPEFLWDWYSVGGRYSGMLKLKIDKKDKKYEWGFYAINPRCGRLFRSKILEEMFSMKKDCRGHYFSEEDFFTELGTYEGYLRVDGCPVSDILNMEKLFCYCFLDKNGNAYSCRRWNGETYEKHEDFDEILKKTIEDSSDCYLTVVDIHS